LQPLLLLLDILLVERSAAGVTYYASASAFSAAYAAASAGSAA